ncbi:hypothetical protein [Frigoribacterium sp. PhB116]|uniref:hypothetical protein n=1 Tax=Frigoribacterium sp. PhB116 TaxID=2485174 RepID=UPI0010DB6EB8|nr:hypothetical protein [Frigoribacterium sp. PhB116]TDT63838.1 hypothetical protein EDF20_1325 [Frigoribacterium sp. PhB116]
MGRSLRAAVLAVVVATAASSALLTGTAGSALAAAPGSSAASPGSTAAPGEAEVPADPGLVSIPFGDEAEVPMAEGWSVADCTAVVPPAGVELGCEPNRLTLSVDEYDPDAGTAVMPVELRTGPTRVTVSYRVEQAPPTPPAAPELVYDHPFDSGAVALVPLSDLLVRCDGCEGVGARLQVRDVSPEGAAVARATPSHLAVQSAPGFVGDAVVSYRLRDAQDQWSETTSLTVAFTAPPAGATGAGTSVAGATGAGPLQALAVTVPLAEQGDTVVDLGALTFAGPTGGGDAADAPHLLGCGAPAAGTVRCSGDEAVWTPPASTDDDPTTDDDPAPDVDQFAFHVATPDGRQATGSVTLVRAGSDAAEALPVGLARVAPVPDRGDDDAAVRTLVPALPADDGDDGAPDAPVLLAPLVSILDRLGGTP